MTNSDQSLSVVLPVYNAQNSLPHLVQQMLDILPDVTADFEILVVDDGSTDQTEEVARELAVRYPQIRVARHAERMGGDAVIRTGYELTRAKVVIVQQENNAFTHADLKRLWQLHTEAPDPAVEVHPTRLDPATEDYLAAWSAAFRNRMRPPTRAQLEAMAAEVEGEEGEPSSEAPFQRTDQPNDKSAGALRSFGPAQPRARTMRR